MRKSIRIALLPLLLLAVSCFREDLPTHFSVPEGTPVTLTIGFGAEAPVDVRVSTKGGASRADESRVHDLYVLIFDNSGTRKYGRYFSYQHKWDNKTPLTDNTNENEGWYVENKTLDGIDPAISQTRGAVKIATTALSNCTLVLLANVSNALVSLGGESPVDALNNVASYNDLKTLPVRLEQDVVVRNDLFLMLGEYPGLDMTHMTWNAGDTSDGFGTAYRVHLAPIDAKVKFRIRGNTDNIQDLTPHKWAVYNIPSSCYLYEKDPYTSYVFPTGDGHHYFDTDPIYFDAEETDANVTWQTFTFYMLESCLQSGAIENPSQAASYYLREKQDKNASPIQYTDETGEHTIYYVSNGDGGRDKQWTYAPERAPFVTFSLSMTLTHDDSQPHVTDGIDGLANWDAQNTKPAGVTGEMSYTVHLGDFTANGANDYNTRRGHFYTYDIVLNNAANLYAEVKSFDPNDPDEEGLEGQPGQEGSLLVNSGGVVNCDAHYEYRSIEFAYNEALAAQLASDPDYHVFSWYVKTPFTDEGRPEWDSNLHQYSVDSTEVDFLWVKFAINELESGSNPKQSNYLNKRIPYPGKNEYDYSWYPGKPGAVVPRLMDINQLINYIYYQYKLRNAGEDGDLFDRNEMIRVTAFVDEYYYEHDPFTGQVDPNLWRKFVNADPREMHILSDVQSSRDRKSNLINSSHSIIQRSIQTIYNVDSPELSSIWGVEHKDEIRETEDESSNDWTGWPWGIANDATINVNVKSTDNGRLNSVALWGLYPSPDADHDEWEDFLEYAVINSIPELKDAAHRLMAYSCLTRNRDNDGDGVIDPEEIRWYMASINQLKGMWIGNESLSTTARVYQPWKGDWRAHVLSSTCPDNASKPKVLNAEEGVATFDYSASGQTWAGGGAAGERLRESVRCVRNVGTYSVGNKAYDISYASYAQMPDQYYTITENADPEHPSDANYITYTIQFRRLDPRSLREYTDKELPFHDEKSPNNRVYLELHTQSCASRATETPDYSDVGTVFPGNGHQVDAGTINEEITNDGYNKYCPTGYRLPNQTELAVMTLALPASYWNSPTRLPTRTYFSHGMYAPVSQQKTGEEKKLGFVYGTNIFLADRKNGTDSQATNRIRCVRDSDMTGAISGRMDLEDTRLMPGQETTLTFNFSSTAAAFASATLYLCYNDAGGNPVEMQIPLATQPEGLHYRTSQSFTAPDPNTLSPAPDALPVPMRLKLELTNVRGNSEEIFYTPFTLTNADIFCEFEILPGSDATKGFPIRVHAETVSGGSSISSLTLQWRKLGDSAWATLGTYDSETGHSFEDAIGKTDFEMNAYFKPNSLETTSYYFRVVAASGSHTMTSTQKSMEFVKVNYTMNDGVTKTGHSWTDPWWNTIPDGGEVPNAYLWHNALVGNVAPAYVNLEQASVINETWQGQKITNLDFAAGDFIEADLDLTNCTFIRTVSGDITKQPYKNQVIGLDNIFSIGKTTINWGNNATNELHFYYPAHVGDNDDQLQVDPVYNGGYINPKLGPLNNGKVVLMLNRDGAWRDGAVISVNDAKYTSVIGNLTTASSLIIGAQEGVHHSRATYNYVRVVHNDLTKASGDVTGGFNQDPQNGGNL